MFVDQVRVKVTSGAGGNGCCSFRREAYVPLGGPNGGDGGDGGDVFFVADSQISTLLDLRYHAHWVGHRGGHGKGKNQHGRKGQDLEIQLPCGTVIRDFETGEIVADLVEAGQRFLAAKGGRGGRGNARFATPTNRAPRFAEKGEPGQTREYLLELKLIAEVGLVGLPNAGKSTLLAAITAAKPKIGNYPFTTLSPNLGVAWLSDERMLTIADIPGIIEGAAEGKGLGHDFLRHIERTRVLLFLIDLGDPDPLHTITILENELERYSHVFTQKKRRYAFNKADISANRETFYKLQIPASMQAHLISGATGENTKELLEELWKDVEEARALELSELSLFPTSVKEYVYKPAFEIVREEGGFRVLGEKPLRAVAMTDFDNPEAIQHLQRRLEKMGLFKALRQMKAQPGQRVIIGSYEMEYQD